MLQLDGASILNKGLDTDSYPLVVQVGIAGPPSAVADLCAALAAPLTNRDVEHMTVLAMTGVTALVRATASRMETKGILYPALNMGDVLRNADLAIMYIPEDRGVELRLESLRSGLFAFWFDPRTGERIPASSTGMPDSPRFDTPAPGDWVLFLKRVRI